MQGVCTATGSAQQSAGHLNSAALHELSVDLPEAIVEAFHLEAPPPCQRPCHKAAHQCKSLRTEMCKASSPSSQKTHGTLEPSCFLDSDWICTSVDIPPAVDLSRWHFLCHFHIKKCLHSVAIAVAHLQANQKPCSPVGQGRQRQCRCGLHALKVLGARIPPEVKASACLHGPSAWCSTVFTQGWYASPERTARVEECASASERHLHSAAMTSA